MKACFIDRELPNKLAMDQSLRWSMTGGSICERIVHRTYQTNTWNYNSPTSAWFN